MITTAVVLAVAQVMAVTAYERGLMDADAEPGTYTLEVPVIGVVGQITVDSSGETASLSFYLSLLVWLAWLLGAFVVGSRLWRVIPRWRDRLRDRRARREAHAAAEG